MEPDRVRPMTEIVQGTIGVRVRPLAVMACSLALIAAGAASCRRAPRSEVSAVASRPSGRGTLKGHVLLIGTPADNDVIRMRADPMCDRANGGKRVLQETVVRSPDGSLGNVFVHLEGSFPDAPVRSEPVLVDQRGCVYLPRVVGLQVGQTLQVRNSDPGLHNVHGVSSANDGFNVGQPVAGLVNSFRLTTEGMTRLQCDVHTWMIAFVGVVAHPYFAVTNTDGTFELDDVPVGSHTIQAWHERYGALTATVQVVADSVAQIDFTYGDQDKRTTALP
jgi:plastocyanin